MLDSSLIDVEVLARRVPALSVLRNRVYTWDEAGEAVAEKFFQRGSRTLPRLAAGSPLMLWKRAKNEMFRLLATDDPEHAEMRRRLSVGSPLPTSSLLPTLSAWLSEVMNIPVDASTALVAMILYRIHESGVGSIISQKALSQIVTLSGLFRDEG